MTAGPDKDWLRRAVPFHSTARRIRRVLRRVVDAPTSGPDRTADSAGCQVRIAIAALAGRSHHAGAIVAEPDVGPESFVIGWIRERDLSSLVVVLLQMPVVHVERPDVLQP